MSYIIPFDEIELADGFALSARAFREHLSNAGLPDHIYAALAALDVNDAEALAKLGAAIRRVVQEAPLPAAIERVLVDAYRTLSRQYGEDATDVAVRSSAIAAELPTATFAGQQESYLNVRGVPALLEAVRSCMASLFTDWAIAYRAERGVDHRKVSLSVSVQKLVLSDLGLAGVRQAS